MNDLDDESRRYKAEAQRLSNEIGRLQNEIQNELFLKSSYEVEKITVEDDLSNLKHLRKTSPSFTHSLSSIVIMQMKLISLNFVRKV